MFIPVDILHDVTAILLAAVVLGLFSIILVALYYIGKVTAKYITPLVWTVLHPITSWQIVKHKAIYKKAGF